MIVLLAQVLFFGAIALRYGVGDKSSASRFVIAGSAAVLAVDALLRLL